MAVRRFPIRRRPRYEFEVLAVYDYNPPAWVTGTKERAAYARASRNAVVITEHQGSHKFAVTVSCGGRMMTLWQLEVRRSRYAPLVATEVVAR